MSPGGKKRPDWRKGILNIFPRGVTSGRRKKNRVDASGGTQREGAIVHREKRHLMGGDARIREFLVVQSREETSDMITFKKKFVYIRVERKELLPFLPEKGEKDLARKGRGVLRKSDENFPPHR